ncbi:exodeoxyribonuclease VII small subunit [Staphylococcus sp. ACRSN]|uniref:exodeoxyribonuclease VII small subunit n=1 Tax=Staphylococcus sp. ACRSN TaxID=2918214 RepID=UPI001EF23BA3|nr:exodeoxyribonuclease VII small subunit [Staphylococcus sp. ACRSN]MCG7339712.1 exodeoxyribonuclease VII small subunit [Staphylococcus sp. ACRSN]
MSNENNQSFEEMMSELETIVQKLDNENVSLEESLNLYQRGMKLSAECDETLKNAEKKVNDLMSNETDEKDVVQNESEDD